MPHGHGAFADALGTRRGDVVEPHHVEHGRAHVAHQRGALEQAQHHDRHDRLAQLLPEILPAGRGQVGTRARATSAELLCLGFERLRAVGVLRSDLRCPFSGAEISAAHDRYAEQLRMARAERVTASVLDSALTAPERNTLAIVQARLCDQPMDPTAEIIPIKRPKKKTLKDLQDAGRRARERLGLSPDSD